MKKVLISFHCDIHSRKEGWLRQFDLVEEVITKSTTIKARILCHDHVERTLEYLVKEFETLFEIKLSELVLPLSEATMVSEALKNQLKG